MNQNKRKVRNKMLKPESVYNKSTVTIKPFRIDNIIVITGRCFQDNDG